MLLPTLSLLSFYKSLQSLLSLDIPITVFLFSQHHICFPSFPTSPLPSLSSPSQHRWHKSSQDRIMLPWLLKARRKLPPHFLWLPPLQAWLEWGSLKHIHACQCIYKRTHTFTPGEKLTKGSALGFRISVLLKDTLTHEVKLPTFQEPAKESC